jgi:type VI secretion system protein
MNRLRLLPVLCVALLPACGTISSFFSKGPPKTEIKQITVSTDIAANAGNATMLDIVFVYDPAAAAQLPKNGPAWFQQKAALENALASGIDVVALQIPAASPNFNVALPKRASKAIGVYAYANYLSEEGQAVANLTPWRQANIHLLPKTVAYSGT